MKVQCPSCREIVEMTDFTTSSAGLNFSCSLCGAANFLANPGSATKPGEPPAAAPEPVPSEGRDVLCPKCGHAQSDPYACHRCGLVFSRFDPESLPPDPPEAAGIWEQIEERPNDEDLHEAFTRACLQDNRLDFATRRYRMFARTPARAPLADRMLKRVAEMGQAQLAPGAFAKGLEKQQGRLLRMVLWGIALTGLVFLAYYVLHATEMIPF